MSTPIRSRNTARMAQISQPFFDSAYGKGLMGVTCHTGPDRRIKICSTGDSVVDYTRCGYLNLDSHPKVLEGAKACQDAAQSVHFSVARTRLSIEPLARLEKQLAGLFGVHAVVVFPSVSAANMGCLPLLAAGLFTNGIKPLVAFDRFAHVTLQYHIPVIREETEVVVVEHNDLDHLEKLCSRGPVAYVCDGAYSMGGAAPVKELWRLQQRYDLFVYLDDAHGISIAGRSGEGFARSQIDALGAGTVIAASLAKGFGASGGLVMVGTPEQDVAIRRYAPTFAFSSGLNMAAVGAALASADIHATAELGQLQRKLQDNLQVFDGLIPTETSGSELPIRILRIGAEEVAIETAKCLLRQGHYTSPVFFPTVPRGRAAIRMSVTAAHRSEDLTELAGLLAGRVHTVT